MDQNKENYRPGEPLENRLRQEADKGSAAAQPEGLLPST